MSHVVETPVLTDRQTVGPSSDVAATTDPADPSLVPGTRVEVRNRLDGSWSRGFEVIDAAPDGYRLRRLSDGGELPLRFGEDDVRRERKRGTWWY